MTQKQEKIDKKHLKTFKANNKQTNTYLKMLESLERAHKQSQSHNIGSINAWKCCNAYACVPLFSHTARAFKLISLKDWV